MKRLYILIFILCLIITSCGLEEEKSALATSQANFSIEMDQTKQVFNNSIKATQETIGKRENEINRTESILKETATFQESIIATQTIIEQKEEEKNNILEAAEEVRNNPEVQNQDPVVDSVLLSTDASLIYESYEFKGYRYEQSSIPGTNLASRFVDYGTSNGNDNVVLMIATHNKSKIPYTYNQIVQDKESGNFTRILINNQPYFFRSMNYGYGAEAASMVVVDADCYVLTFVRTKYDENTSPLVDFLIDANLKILESNQPLCEGS